MVALFAGQEAPNILYTLAEGGAGDWFGGLLFSAGQQANEAVQGQLAALSFSRYESPILFSVDVCTAKLTRRCL